MANTHRKISRVKKENKFQDFFNKTMEEKLGKPIPNLFIGVNPPILSTNDESVIKEKEDNIALLSLVAMSAMLRNDAVKIAKSKEMLMNVDWDNLLKK